MSTSLERARHENAIMRSETRGHKLVCLSSGMRSKEGPKPKIWPEPTPEMAPPRGFEPFSAPSQNTKGDLFELSRGLQTGTYQRAILNAY
ncbi:hypothetical protein [Mesorhizobium sp. 43Arga]